MKVEEPCFEVDGVPFYQVLDCPAARVSEFFVRFGKPEAGVDVEIFLEYVDAWKPDWEEFEPMQIENGE